MLDIMKYQLCIDIQSEHNYVILSGIIQRINYMFRPKPQGLCLILGNEKSSDVCLGKRAATLNRSDQTQYIQNVKSQ